ncbi:MAG: restriction endonuclease subunit S [Methylococcales bacterium]
MLEKLKIGDICNIKTGKLDANQFVLGGEYPFYTCAPEPLTIDSYAFDDSVILIAGNNAAGNFHVNRFNGKFNAYQRTGIVNLR